jgi:hypothetical protein
MAGRNASPFDGEAPRISQTGFPMTGCGSRNAGLSTQPSTAGHPVVDMGDSIAANRDQGPEVGGVNLRGACRVDQRRVIGDDSGQMVSRFRG